MSSLRNMRVFLLLVVLLFAFGHSHQVLGRFNPHHHHADIVGHSSHSDRHSPGDDQQKDAEHMAEHIAVVAIVIPALAPALGTLHVLGSVDSGAVPKAEPRPVRIEHPPQLIG